MIIVMDLINDDCWQRTYTATLVYFYLKQILGIETSLGISGYLIYTTVYLSIGFVIMLP